MRVIGCGAMGGGIAQTCVQSGYYVTVLEISAELLDRELTSIDSSLTKNVNRGQFSQQDLNNP